MRFISRSNALGRPHYVTSRSALHLSDWQRPGCGDRGRPRSRLGSFVLWTTTRLPLQLPLRSVSRLFRLFIELRCCCCCCCCDASAIVTAMSCACKEFARTENSDATAHLSDLSDTNIQWTGLGPYMRLNAVLANIATVALVLLIRFTETRQCDTKR